MEFYSKRDVFSEGIRLELLEKLERHFEDNLYDADNGIVQLTECVIDCHGLALSPSSYFPYIDRCWNIFVLKVRDCIHEYAEQIGVNPTSMIPFSCYAERLSYNMFEGLDPETWKHTIWRRFYQSGDAYDLKDWRVNKDAGMITGVKDRGDVRVLNDKQVKCPFIRTVFYLQNKDQAYGTHIETKKGTYRHLGEENSLLIYPNLPSYNVLPHNPEHIEISPPTNIIFEWYIWDLPPTGAKGFGQTLMPPDWVLP